MAQARFTKSMLINFLIIVGNLSSAKIQSGSYQSQNKELVK